MPRKGLTLLELLVVLGIVGVLISITVVAVAAARQAYLSLQCKNNQKQIMVGLLSHLQQNQKLVDNNLGVPQVNIFPYILNQMGRIGPKAIIEKKNGVDTFINYEGDRIPEFMCPSDFTTVLESKFDGRIDVYGNKVISDSYLFSSSYCGNGFVFLANNRFPQSISDGMSNTIAFCETYSKTGGEDSIVFSYNQLPFRSNSGGSYGSSRPAIFANRTYDDILPARDPATRQTVASQRGVTFQVRPPFMESNHHYPISNHSGGMNTAFLDGSVRWLSSDLGETPFWAMVTPDWND
jgi:prepilin-type N-terminal cleavage/methylation domain-containing protein/prepilin-type processing-associated H-X9-DG protein